MNTQAPAYLSAGSGFTERRSVLLSFLAAAVATPLDTIVSYPFISKIDQSLLALAAGVLVALGIMLSKE